MKVILYSSVLLFTCFIFRNSFSQNVYDDSQVNGTNYSRAAFRVWISDTTKPVKGIIVLVPGSGSDGRNAVYDETWQALAEESGFALLACFFRDYRHEHMDIEEYVNVSRGSGQALLQCIRRISESSGHPELDTVPLMMFGMSAGGEFNYEFACWAPERVRAFVVNKGGIYYTALAPAATWNIPGLFITGEKDSPYRINIIKGIFSINRRFGAKWTYGCEHGVAHETGKSELLAQSFFREVLKLGDMPAESAEEYTGLIEDKKVIRTETCNDLSSTLTSWIVSKKFGEEWMEFIGE